LGLDRIVVGRGLVRIDDLAAELGWSRKRLWSRFHSHLGIPPKSAAKLVRFDHSVHRLVAGEGAAQVAADGGYCDQSHLHRDVMAFTGTTPVTVLGEPWLTVDDRAWPTAEHPPKTPVSMDLGSVAVTDVGSRGSPRIRHVVETPVSETS
jgi:AraC-like DNA-binding protein